MEYQKNTLFNTNLPILSINKNRIADTYIKIGSGDEGNVFKYNSHLAFKTFDFIDDRDVLTKKFAKIELLGKLQDPNVCFPFGLVFHETVEKIGYYYELVNFLPNFKDFDDLKRLKETKKILEYLIKADEAIQRLHQMGIVIGDIKENNIMIDQNCNIKFIDTDNWMYAGYNFDLFPSRANRLNATFNKDFSLYDNDRFVFASMAIQYFLDDSLISQYKSDEYFKALIARMDVSQEIKDELRLIFSDANEKPYIGPILKKVNPNVDIFPNRRLHPLQKQ